MRYLGLRGMFVPYKHFEATAACNSLAPDSSLGAQDLAPLNVNLNDNDTDIQPPDRRLPDTAHRSPSSHLLDVYPLVVFESLPACDHGG